MRKLVLVKHSLPEIDPTVAASRWHLSEVGRLRCHSLAERLADYDIGAVVSSMEPKAVETATIVGERLGLAHDIVEGLHEHERDEVGFLPRAEFEGRVADFFARQGALVLGSETGEDAYARFAKASDAVIETYPRGDLAVVTHGTVISLFVSRATGTDPLPLWKRLQLPSLVVLSLPEFHLLDLVEDPSG